jgi:hypothetical protein
MVSDVRGGQSVPINNHNSIINNNSIITDQQSSMHAARSRDERNGRGGLDAYRSVRFRLAAFAPSLPSAVRVRFGKWATVRFLFAALAAFLMFRPAAARCLDDAIYPSAECRLLLFRPLV